MRIFFSEMQRLSPVRIAAEPWTDQGGIKNTILDALNLPNRAEALRGQIEDWSRLVTKMYHPAPSAH
jgi:hypothetical protein